ncbi:MAG: alkaline phosphatase family protein [Atribacterota bacterium]|nr:alkaline phosphatase family protein [Atribacterota bacterium]
MFIGKKNSIKLKARRISIFNNKNWSSSCLFIFLLFILLSISFDGLAEPEPKFLIVHLDALSSPNFFQYMEEGHFPNLKSIFQDGDGHVIPYGLALFPGGTETTVPHLRKGEDNSTGGVGWGYYDREKEKVVPKYVTFFDMFSHIPRRAKAGFIYGVPYLDFFNFYPIMNLPELLDSYNVLQFFWFATDSLGHYFGEKPYLASYKRFDSYIGRLVKRLDMDEVNLIIYSDHGMSFGRFIDSPQEEEIKRIIGDDLKVYIHPNVYLDNPDEKDYWAQKITLESEIDFAFFRENAEEVVGYTDYGKIIFQGDSHDKIRYLYEGEDAFDYYKDDYRGEWLDADEWLSLTKESKYPGVPPNVYNLLMNEKAGDIVIVINPPRIPIFNLRYPANHAGLTKTDLLVPILLKGKELEHLYDTEEIWLHDLFNQIPSLDLNSKPDREKHSFSFWGNLQDGQYPGFELSISPAYRWNVVLQYENDLYNGRFEYDFYSSYVIRLWIGAGLEYQEKEYEPFLHTRIQMDFDKIRFNYGVQSHLFDLKNWEENKKELIYKVNNRLSIDWQIPNRLGFSIYW